MIKASSSHIIVNDSLDALKSAPDKWVQTCVTSPPYWGLRDYGVDGQLGLEPTPDQFVQKLVSIFREVRRCLKDDGTLWLNLGDSYAGGGNGRVSKVDETSKQATNRGARGQVGEAMPMPKPKDFGLKPKDLVGIPWRVAFALQADGWYLRQDIIWAKPNPMPESVRDRCTKSHEYIFLFSKSPKYYFNNDAIKEPVAQSTIKRLSQNIAAQRGSDRVPGKTNGPMKAVFGGRNKHSGYGTRLHSGREDSGNYLECGRNKRSVWTVTTKPFKGAHFATFPMDLIEPCILAGSKKGDVVLDPFAGAGTTGVVCKRHGREFVGIEINPEYAEIAEKRILEATA